MLTDIFAIAICLLASASLVWHSVLQGKIRGLRRQVATTELASDALRKTCDQMAAQLGAILSASSDAILLCDAAGLCQPLNEQARLLFWPAGSGTLLALSRSGELDALLREARIAGRGPVTGEVILRAIGERVMQTLITRVPSDGADNIGYLILLRDVTDLRHLETVRRDFVANVSHELRTPLSSMKAMAETLLDGALEDQAVARRFLETIVRETDRLVRLSADLLDLSRIEAQPVVKQDHDVSALIDDIVSRLSSQRNKADVSLSVDLSRPLIVPCDADEIAQLLVNLLDNAYKYTSGGGSVTISGRVIGGRVVVEVADTGIGILQQDLPRLFERFYRSDKARSRQSGGTGLGLSIVKHVVERHGGDLWVRSEYNRGSVFGFALPDARDQAIAMQQAPPAPAQTSGYPAADYVVVGQAHPLESVR
jgi:two-component system phosphate regulon sensor histidine kinase PhoR